MSGDLITVGFEFSTVQVAYLRIFVFLILASIYMFLLYWKAKNKTRIRISDV